MQSDDEISAISASPNYSPNRNSLTHQIFEVKKSSPVSLIIINTFTIKKKKLDNLHMFLKKHELKHISSK